VSETNVAKFTLDGKTYVIKIDFKTAYVLTEKFDFPILKLFIDEQLTQQMMMKLLLDTQYTIDLCWYFLENKVTFGKQALFEYITDAASLEPFREAMWAAVVNFSSPLIRGMLMDMWTTSKKELKRLKVDSEILTQSSSESNPEE